MGMAGGTCQTNISDGQIPKGNCAEAGPITRGWDSVGIALPLVPSEDANESRLFSNIPNSLLAAAKLKNVSYHVHSGGVGVATFHSNAHVSGTYRALSTNRDSKGRHFVSMVEGIK